MSYKYRIVAKQKQTGRVIYELQEKTWFFFWRLESWHPTLQVMQELAKSRKDAFTPGYVKLGIIEKN